jgi:4-hydroxyphenylpyruvate dioxygenase
MTPDYLGCTTATFGGKLPGKLEAMRAAGFTAIEFWPRDLFEHAEGPDVAINLLRRTGLRVAAYQALRNYEGMPAEVRRQKLGVAAQLMDQMALVGADLLVLCSNTDPGSSGDRAHMVDDLRVLGDLARRRGVRIAYEGLSWGRWIRDYRDAWALIEATDHEQVGMLLDGFHIFVMDLPMTAIDGMRVEKIFLVELADLPGTRLDVLEVSRHYRLFPGEGIAPIDEFVQRVRGIGYTGCWSVEVFNAHYLALSPDAVAMRAARAMAGALGHTERVTH